MIRSLGGWSKAKKLRGKGRDHVMSDERILGDTDFVDSVLSQAREEYERRYEVERICGTLLTICTNHLIIGRKIDQMTICNLFNGPDFKNF